MDVGWITPPSGCSIANADFERKMPGEAFFVSRRGRERLVGS